jgi:transposase
VGERQSYSREFKDAIRAKILNRGNRSVAEVCEEEGVSHRTAANWIRPHVKPEAMKKQKNSSQWNPEQKLKALMETASLSEAELGAYLRKEGIFSHQLDEWKSEFLSLMVASYKPKYTKKDDRDQKIKTLEKEILRKDKALAEATALLILQKKVNLIWGNKDEDDE